jgi:ElaB/YqjD/DUF883 family membrane-anchored ribosome-binding protein
MAAILVEADVERKPVGACAAACMANDVKNDVKEAAKRIEKRVHKVKDGFFDKVDDGKIAAERLVKHGRYAVEDGFAEAVHKVKREPVKFVAIAFAAGAFLGFVMPRLGRRSA